MLLIRLLEWGLLPVVSPISMGTDGAIYNVNADEAATAVAAALSADVIDFVSNVAGVVDSDGRIVRRLTPQTVEALIAGAVIRGGMIPKVRAAMQALDQGVRAARIVDLEGLATSQGTLFAHAAEGAEGSETGAGLMGGM
jgi:acetylglutamate kinase